MPCCSITSSRKESYDCESHAAGLSLCTHLTLHCTEHIDTYLPLYTCKHTHKRSWSVIRVFACAAKSLIILREYTKKCPQQRAHTRTHLQPFSLLLFKSTTKQTARLLWFLVSSSSFLSLLSYTGSDSSFK